MKNPTPFGKYCLLERISVGGMAEVFRAKTFGVQGFSKRIAIKRILPNMAEDSEFVTMFIDEAKIAAQLNHSNICQIYELGKIGKFHYIAMEHIHGKNLLQLQNRFRKDGQFMPPYMAAYIIQKVCEGLDYAHRKKDHNLVDLSLVHRDVSPQNVIVSFDGEVKIIDFGIAKAASRSTRTQVGVLKGKFGYMSPEQVRGLALDHRSDIFATGTVTHEILTGQRLFNAESDFATLEQVRKVDIDSPRAINPDIPEELERITLKALTRDRDHRYQWCRELAEDVARFLQNYRAGYSAKDLADWMRATYAEELEAEKEKLEFFATIRSQEDLLALQPQPHPMPDADDGGARDPNEIEEEATAVFAYDPSGSEVDALAMTPPPHDVQALRDLLDSDVTVQMDDDDDDDDDDEAALATPALGDASEMATEAVQAVSEEEYARIMADASAHFGRGNIPLETMPPPATGRAMLAPTHLPPGAEGSPPPVSAAAPTAELAAAEGGATTVETAAVDASLTASSVPFAMTTPLEQLPASIQASMDLVAGTMNLSLDELEFVRGRPSAGDAGLGPLQGGARVASTAAGTAPPTAGDSSDSAPTPSDPLLSSGAATAALADTDSLQAVRRSALADPARPGSATGTPPSGVTTPTGERALGLADTPPSGLIAVTPPPSQVTTPPPAIAALPAIGKEHAVRLEVDDPELSALHDGPETPFPLRPPAPSPAPAAAGPNPTAQQGPDPSAQAAKPRTGAGGSGLGIVVGVVVAVVVVALGVGAWFLGLRPLVQRWTRGAATLEVSVPRPDAVRSVRVLLDGEEVGVAIPLRLEELEAGPHRLRIETERFEPYDVDLTLEDEGVLAHEATLTPKAEVFGTLHIRLQPGGPARIDTGAGQQVDVPAGEKGATLSLNPGQEFEVVISGPEVITVRRKMTLDFEEERTEDVVLQPYRGRITLSSTPARARVFINGRPAGRTPFDKTDLDPAVAYAIEVRHRGRETWAHTVRFDGDHPTFEQELTLSRPEPEAPSEPAAPPEDSEAAPTPEAAAGGFLTISAATPIGEEVWIDGEKTGRRTPITSVSKLELSGGEHTLTLKLGSRSATVRLDIKPGETFHVRKKRLRSNP